MKKLILLLSMLLCVMLSAKTLTNSEKKEILKQFLEFQQVVKNEDVETAVTMIKFPLDDSGEIVPKGDSVKPITKQEFLEYGSNSFEFLKKLTYLNVDLNTLSISKYVEEGNACSMSYNGKFKGDELWITLDFIPNLTTSCSGGYDTRFKLISKKLKLVGINYR